MKSEKKIKRGAALTKGQVEYASRIAARVGCSWSAAVGIILDAHAICPKCGKGGKK